MPRVVFTSNLRRHVDCPEMTVNGSTLREALEQAFLQRPTLQGYVVDEQFSLRTHLAIFVSGKPIRDRISLSDSVHDNDEIYVMQALSGG